MPTERLPLSAIYPNPKNPRFVKDNRFGLLIESLRSFPQMLEYRPILVDDDGMILAGNQRYQAAKALNMDTVPVQRVTGLTAEQMQELIVKDNVHVGEFAFSSFFDHANDWDVFELQAWGLDLPFAPKTDPTADRTEVTDRDMASASNKLATPFSQGATKREITCPHCAGDFYIDN